MSDMFGLRQLAACGWFFTLVSTGSLSACVYDANDRCGVDQTFDAPAGLCVITCDANANLVPVDRSCVPCGEHARAENNVCTCVEGYRRASPGAACIPVPEALGAECQQDGDCADPTVGTCHLLDDGSGYCTSAGCVENNDCAAGYACNTKASPAYCQRPPLGAGQVCSTDADCAGTEATFCESFRSKVCFVEGCSLTNDDCFPGQECCDLTGPSFGLYKKQICVDRGTCAQ